MSYSKFIVLFVLLGLFSCKEKRSSTAPAGDLEVISVDISKARKGKMSEFFESEIEYIWLKDDSEEAQIGGGVQKVMIEDDKIIVLDIFGCKCLQVFDRVTGRFLAKVKAYGEAPGKYLDFDDVILVDGELLLLGVYPRKLMWFDLKGNFLRERKVTDRVDTGIFDENQERYFFYGERREPEKYSLVSLSAALTDSIQSFPFVEGTFQGNYPNRNVFVKSDGIYMGRQFNDTIMALKGTQFQPTLVFDFGRYGQDMDEFKDLKNELEPLEFMNFINNRAKLSFIPHAWYVDENQLYTNLKYEDTSYKVVYNRGSRETHIIEGRLENDLDGGYDSYGIQYHFGGKRAGIRISGKDLYKLLYEKRQELGQSEFDEYINGEGKSFAKAAVAAKDSENPVLIVYTFTK